MIELLCENVNTPLRLYFHSQYSLEIILNLEFHILAKPVYGYPQKHFGSYQTSRIEGFFAKFEPIGPKILFAFCKIYLRTCTLITSKVRNSNLELFSLEFYDHNVFHDADCT